MATDERPFADYVAHLYDRAESYWRDGKRLEEDGDAPMAAAYWTIAQELRDVAAYAAACRDRRIGDGD